MAVDVCKVILEYPNSLWFINIIMKIATRTLRATQRKDWPSDKMFSEHAIIIYSIVLWGCFSAGIGMLVEVEGNTNAEIFHQNFVTSC